MIQLEAVAVAFGVPLGEELKVRVDDQLVALDVAGTVAALRLGLAASSAARAGRNDVVTVTSPARDGFRKAVVLSFPIPDCRDAGHMLIAADLRERFACG